MDALPRFQGLLVAGSSNTGGTLSHSRCGKRRLVGCCQDGPMRTLTVRDLNRALLARQLLLARTDRHALEVVEHLTGLQAQDPDPPYVGLWSRITGFTVADLTGLLYERTVVRATLFRGTQHLVTAEDYLWIRPLMQPYLDRWQKAAFGKATVGLDLIELREFVRKLLDDGPMTRPELGKALVARWPGRDPVSLARSAQGLLAIVHPPPDGTWGRRGVTPFELAENWLRRPLEPDPAAAARLILRYLAAFGPASVKDVQAWSGLTRLREVVEPLRGQLRSFRTEGGVELLDLPDAPRPDADEPAPVRLLAALDNVVLGHADRTRIVNDELRPHTIVDATVTIDGFVRGVWKLKNDKGRTVLTARTREPLSAADQDAVGEEAELLLAFAGAEAHDVRFEPLTV